MEWPPTAHQTSPSLSIFKTHLKTLYYYLALNPAWHSALVLLFFVFYCFNIVTVSLFQHCYYFIVFILFLFYVSYCMFYFLCMYSTLSQLWLFKVLHKLSWVELSIFLFMKYIVRLGFSLGPLGHYCNTTGLKLMLALLLGNILKTSILMKCSWWLSFSQRSSNTDTLGWPMEWEDQSP